MFLNNQRRHNKVVSLLTTTVLSLSLRSLVCYQTNSPSCTTPSGSRKHFSDIRRQEYYHLFRQRSRELLVAATHARDVWAMWAAGERPFDELFSSYRRKSFTTIMHKVSFWRLKWSQLLRKCVSQNKPKNAGRSQENAGMRKIHQNAGFPARLRDGWHRVILGTPHYDLR